MSEILQAIVIDNGSAFSKAGFAGTTAPSVVLPSVTKEGHSFIQRGVVVDWSAMENMWQHIFEELKVNPKEYGVLLTESVLQSKEARETAAKILFEKFNVPAVYFSNTASLSLFSTGKLTGIALESGDGLTQIVPLKNGKVIAEGVAKYNIGGSDLNHFMINLLKKRGVDVGALQAKQCKEQLGYVALSYEEELNKPISAFEKPFQLPDGKTITVGLERLEVTEAMFQPHFMGEETIGITEMIHSALKKCGEATVGKTIVVGGGNTLFDGMVERLNKELNGMEVVAAPKYSAWIGGSIMAHLPTFQPLWIRKKDYEQHGPSILHK